MSSEKSKNSKTLNSALRKRLQPGPERGGLILPQNKLVEFPNTAGDDYSYLPKLTPADASSFDQAIGTWHTHPDSTSNLSAGDAQTFKQWPALLHAVVGTDGVSWYCVKDGSVMNA